MKKKTTKKDFQRFAKVNTHKRRAKNRAVNEIKKALDEAEISYSGILLRDREDKGAPDGFRTAKRRGREIFARGVFSGSKSGFGFVTLDSGSDRDIFIPRESVHGALDGDYVEIAYRVFKNYAGEEKTEGRVVKIVSYGVTELIGTLVCERSFSRRGRDSAVYYLLPDDPKISLRPTVDERAGAKEGEKVIARLNRSQRNTSPTASVNTVLGQTLSKEANYLAILAESGIPLEFSEQELRDAEEAARKPLSDEGRVRFNNHTVMTIDGAGAKDLDDAVGVRKLPSGWRLYVHIADVSAYVGEKTPLDRAVTERGTSVYFTDKVVPMLPPCLSNGACSLNEGEEKYAMSAVITLDEEGEILKTEIFPSIIVSAKRGVYSEVNSIFAGEASAQLKRAYGKTLPTLKRMRELYLLLKKKAEKRGSLELETAEAEIILGEDGMPKNILRAQRGEAERMIEQFMLTANEGVATLLTERGIPCVYRVHKEPPEEKLEEFLRFAHNLGFDTSLVSREKKKTADFSALLEAAKREGLGEQVSYSMLRSMSKAEYSEVCGGHFGLGIERYCHFTSPIRRLSDLATHRIIRRVMLENKKPSAYASYARRAAKAATDAENRAMGAERRIENLYKVLYMSDMIGEKFDAKVSSVTSFGLFVALENTCEGLIPLSEMPGYFVFDERTLTVRSSGEAYRLGDGVRVRLEEADIIRGKLRFSLVKK